MKRIIKNYEPKSLLEHRLQPFADYDNYPQKNELRASLTYAVLGTLGYRASTIPSDNENWLL
ncbi:MAG: hypothetical protein KME60_33620 [Cyanomargarita calcarea GSE-NOS-MK-12-04C]|jgi:hypothetical protein|uniref:Uncharacterized protein n=1 Tax=Cyanomargarita calcarea GSE-NOS-MK-12-04C TaxID=2839659 RepID=A0A951QV04_9CYAN|nr:hypothetical protein [Cyanomargarita calcarea GSE-NOS-MK-12-04C]